MKHQDILASWQVNLPEYALPYLIDGDSSSLGQDDIDATDHWLAYLNAYAKSKGGQVMITADKSPWFALSGAQTVIHHLNPAFGPPAPCIVGKVEIVFLDPKIVKR